MKTSKSTESQIMALLKEADAAMAAISRGRSGNGKIDNNSNGMARQFASSLHQ